MPGYTLRGLIPDVLMDRLDIYRAGVHLSRTAALRFLLSTHPDLQKLERALSAKPGPKPKPFNFGIPGSQVPGARPGTHYSPLDQQEAAAVRWAAGTGQPVTPVPDWVRAAAKPPRPPVQDTPTDGTVAAATAIIEELQRGVIDAGSALAELEDLAAQGITHRHAISGLLHVARTWESEPSD